MLNRYLALLLVPAFIFSNLVIENAQAQQPATTAPQEAKKPRTKFIPRAGTGGTPRSSDGDIGESEDSSAGSDEQKLNQVLKRRKAKAPPKPIDVNEVAASELVLPAESKTHNVLPTPATVRSTIDQVENPVTRPELELGVSAEYYQPQGSVSFPGMNGYRLGDLKPMPMVAAEVRWTPFEFANYPNYGLGLFANIGYSQSDVKLNSPTGFAIEGTVLRSIKIQTGTSLQWQPGVGSPWGARLQLGLGQLQVSQSSTTSFVSFSASQPFASFGFQAERKFLGRWSGYVGYDYRLPLKAESEELILQRSNIMAGILGGFQ